MKTRSHDFRRRNRKDSEWTCKKERVVIAEAMSKSKQGQTSKGKVPLNQLTMDDI